ncbi:hypothetical protein BDR26DRAFT_865429 [Obelidium mucronatum]|nr:hypothetical protein BDR26DRAFT_865429 [Obelidium mucronatum]
MDSKAHEALANPSSTTSYLPPPPSYSNNPLNNNNNQEARLQAFKSIVARHEISNFMAVKMRRLESYDIVVIADDSGSMSCRTTVGKTTTTRWSELKDTLTIVTEIGSVLDEDGVDIYFMNRPAVRNVKGPSLEMDRAFANPPNGGTPTGQILSQVLREKAAKMGDQSKKLLILVATDGEPNNKQEVYNALMNERGPNPRDGSVIVVFLACTDDERAVGFLNEWDKTIPCVDVVDDYNSERKEILAVQGTQFPFSRGDWVCKMLLGAIDPEIDALDERKVASSSTQNSATQPQSMATTGSAHSLAVPSPQLGRRASNMSSKSNRSSSGKKECIIQ